MSARHHRLGARATAVFTSWLGGRAHDLHPSDRSEADAFWMWLGEFDRPRNADTVLPGRQLPGWTAIAAVIALVAIGISSWLVERAQPRALEQSIVASNGERRVVRLADGSVITLAAGSQVDIRFMRDERRLWLRRGEALFKVAHNRARPFIVQTIHGEIKAVGTAFDVEVGSKDAQVTVVEGIIQVTLPVERNQSSGPTVKLASKGERVEFGVAKNKSRGETTAFMSQSNIVDIDNVLAWTRGQLVFNGEPLSQVIAIVNRYARPSAQIELTTPAAASLPVFGVIDQGDTTAVSNIIDDPDVISFGKGHTHQPVRRQ